jgi:hypothetical protein
VHGNVAHVLRALGSPLTSTGHVRGMGHRGSRRFLLLGKGSPCRGRPGGEMTGTGVVGCMLAKRRCPWWPCRRLGGRGVIGLCLCSMGSGSGSLRGGDRLHGVKGSSGRRVEGEGDVLAGASGSPSPLDAKRKRTRRKVLLNALPFRGRSPADLLPSSWSAKEKKRERDGFCGGSRVCNPGIQIWKYEFICKRLLKPTK